MIIFITVAILLLLVTLSLVGGLVSMVRGEKISPKWSNKFMQYRVIFQGMAIAILFLLFLFMHNQG